MTGTEKKIFFCGNAGFDNPGAWVKMWTEEEARKYVSTSLEIAGWKDRPLKSFHIEWHYGGEVRTYIWGIDEPGFKGDEHGEFVGRRVEIDGVVVYDDLKASESSD